MKSEQLVDYMREVTDRCAVRIMGPGNDQYSSLDALTGEPVQLVEQLPLFDVCTWAMEELEDLIVYASALHLRFTRLQDMVTSHKIKHTYR